jgi:hypothetical protein
MSGTGATTARWLLLIHQLPPSPAYLRVKTARQLQKIGAVAVKDSVYVLPNTEAAAESFIWLSKEIAAGGGETTLCESSFIGATSNEVIEALFHAVRGQDYQQLGEEVRAAIKALGKSRQPDDDRRAAAASALSRFRRLMTQVEELDFFGAPGREATASLLTTLEERLRGPVDDEAPAARVAGDREVTGAVWVTRKGVHVDRIASAWLITRFIDRAATLKFVSPKGYSPLAGELRFDMFEAEYTHDGDRCTFEVLAKRFQVADPAVAAMGEVVHDIDVRDGKFGRAETAGVERLINGIVLTQPDDDARVALGSQLCDALYEAWKRKKT